MVAKTRQIEIDEATAEALEKEALARGLSVAALLAELVESDPANDFEDIGELDRRWANAKAGGAVAHDQIVAWLETWGTPEFKPFRVK